MQVRMGFTNLFYPVIRVETGGRLLVHCKVITTALVTNAQSFALGGFRVFPGDEVETETPVLFPVELNGKGVASFRGVQSARLSRISGQSGDTRQLVVYRDSLIHDHTLFLFCFLFFSFLEEIASTTRLFSGSRVRLSI